MGKLSGAEKKVVPVVYALVPKEPLWSRRDEECSSVSFGNTWKPLCFEETESVHSLLRREEPKGIRG